MSYAILKNVGINSQIISANSPITQQAYDSIQGFPDYAIGHGLLDGKLVAPSDGFYRFHFTTRFLPSTGDGSQLAIALLVNGLLQSPKYRYSLPTSLVAGGCSPAAIRASQTLRMSTGNGNPTPNVALNAAPIPGNLQVVFSEWDTPASNSITGVNQAGTTSLAFTQLPTSPLSVAPTQQNFRLGAFYRFAKAGDTAFLNFNTTGAGGRKQVIYMEFSGVDAFDNFATVQITANNPTPFNFGPLSPVSTGKPGLIVGFAMPANNVNDTWSAVSDTPLTFIEDYDFGPSGSLLYGWGGHIVVSGFSGSYSGSISPTHGGITRGYSTWFISFSCNAPATSSPFQMISGYGIVPLLAGDLLQLRSNVSGGATETWRIFGEEFGMELMSSAR